MSSCAPPCYIPVPGPPGPPGPPGGVVQAVAAHPLGGHRLVVPRDDGTVEYADATNQAHLNRPIWLTTSAWAAGATATLTAVGAVVEPAWAWTPGAPLLLGASGLMTHTLPGGAQFVRRVALPSAPSAIWFSPDQPIDL